MNITTRTKDEPDWTREQIIPGEWNPGKLLLASIREYQQYKSGYTWIEKFFKFRAILRHRLWSAITGADIPLNCNIAGGLLLPHPNGVVIHPDSKIGPNCLIFQQVTIGTVESGGVPLIEANVDIGAGAKLLGNIRIGQGARIGANAVVLCDVPSGAAAVGVPARLVLTKKDKPTNDPA